MRNSASQLAYGDAGFVVKEALEKTSFFGNHRLSRAMFVFRSRAYLMCFQAGHRSVNFALLGSAGVPPGAPG